MIKFITQYLVIMNRERKKMNERNDRWMKDKTQLTGIHTHIKFLPIGCLTYMHSFKSNMHLNS
jgi:hypothetical protein